jgi:hypothetical protein
MFFYHYITCLKDRLHRGPRLTGRTRAAAVRSDALCFMRRYSSSSSGDYNIGYSIGYMCLYRFLWPSFYQPVFSFSALLFYVLLFIELSESSFSRFMVWPPEAAQGRD